MLEFRYLNVFCVFLPLGIWFPVTHIRFNVFLTGCPNTSLRRQGDGVGCRFKCQNPYSICNIIIIIVISINGSHFGFLAYMLSILIKPYMRNGQSYIKHKQCKNTVFWDNKHSSVAAILDFRREYHVQTHHFSQYNTQVVEIFNKTFRCLKYS